MEDGNGSGEGQGEGGAKGEREREDGEGKGKGEGERADLAGILDDKTLSSRVHGGKLADVVHAAVDCDPHVSLGVVASHFFPADGAGHQTQRVERLTGPNQS